MRHTKLPPLSPAERATVLGDPPPLKSRAVPAVIALRLAPEIRRRLQLAVNNLPHFSRHSVAMTALAAGLDRVTNFADFAAAAVITGQPRRPRKPQCRD